MTSLSSNKTLDYYYTWVHTHLLSKQKYALGLFPHTRYAYVTDNVFCAVTLWALSKVFDKLDDGSGRQIELQQTAIKTMRAILFCYTKQLDKLEMFKNNQDPKHCLHAKFDPKSGDEVVENWHHMQMHSVSLFLLYLAQMTRSGLSIIYTIQEVHIVQNLVYYIERSYRIRDYGAWGQGRKEKPYEPELSASSIAQATAALMACDGLKLFGPESSMETALFVDPDALFRNKSILHGFLPRESQTKDVDAALILSKGFPAFAVRDQDLCEQIENNVNSELLGKCGYKRFIGDKIGLNLDGLSSEGEVIETDGKECEWPFLLLLQIITRIFNKDWEGAAKYRAIVNPLLYESEGYPTIPHKFSFDSTKNERVPEKDQPVIVHQALLILTELLEKKLIEPHDIDYRKSTNESPGFSNRVIQVALLAESTSFQALLSTYGISTQTPTQIESVYIWPNSKLMNLLNHHGQDDDLKLTGRPTRPLGSLCTSRVWKINSKTVMCVPLYQDKQDFYICRDENFIANSIKSHLKFLVNNWEERERPTFCLMLTSALFKKDSMPLLDLLHMLNSGLCNGVRVKVGRLQELIPMANQPCIHANVDIDFHENRILASPVLMRRSLSMKSNPENENGKSDVDEKRSSYLKIEEECRKTDSNELMSYFGSDDYQTPFKVLALIELAKRHGSDYNIHGETIKEHIQHLYKATDSCWLVLRCCAGFLGKSVDSLAPSVSTVIVSGRFLSFGVFGFPETLVLGPLHPRKLDNIFHETIRHQNVLHVCLQQEFLIYIAEILDEHPELFKGVLILRIGWIIHIINEILSLQDIRIECLSPHYLKKRVLDLLMNNNEFCKDKSWPKFRLINGMLGKVPDQFYKRVWNILQLSNRNIQFRLKSRSLNSSHCRRIKSTEPKFAMKVEKFLSVLDDPVVRYFVIELFQVVSYMVERNPEIQFHGDIDLLDLVEKSGVCDTDSSEEASMKFVNVLVTGKFIDVGQCTIS